MRVAACSRVLSGLALVWLAAGCASSEPRGGYLREIQPGGITNLVAYRSGTNLDIRIPLRGKDAFAHASWEPVSGAAQGYEHRFAVLSLEKEAPGTRHAVVGRSHRLAVRDAKQWQQLVQEIFSGFVPGKPGHGVLLFVQDEETVIYRDAAGKPGLVSLENKPPEITVDQTYNDADFSREAIRLLEARVGPVEQGQAQYLFATGSDPAFVLVDAQQRLVVFFGYPSDPESPAVQGWFAVRALNSLFVKSFVIAAIKNPCTLVGRGLWHLGNSGAAAVMMGPSAPNGTPPPLYEGQGMDLGAWEKELDGLVSERRYKGRVQLYIDGEKFFPAMIDSVQGAKRSVDVSVFIFDTDNYAVKIADLLKNRSRQVHVRVLMDDLGSLFAAQTTPPSQGPSDFVPPGNIVSYLRSGSRIHVRTTSNPWLTMDHRKCIIVDGRQAYIGGMNIGREYRYDWHDMMVGLTGPVVGRLEKDYRKAWAHAGPLGDFAYGWVSLFDREGPRKNEANGAIDIRPLRTATGRLEIFRAQLAAIERSKRYIYIENAYFDDAMVLGALLRARQRGVDVRVIFPARNDSNLMQTTDLMVANEMVRGGVRVYVYPRMTHVKAAIYDGWACVGSANFDKMSLRISQELDVAYSDAASVEELRNDLFDTDFKRSHELKEPVALDWFDPLIKAFANQL
jgi:cardiolipin synthase